MAKKKTVKKAHKRHVTPKRKKNLLSIFFVFIAAGIIGVPLAALISFPSSGRVAGISTSLPTPTPGNPLATPTPAPTKPWK